MEKLGIDPIQLGAQMLHFVLLLIAFKYLLYKPILKMIQKRQKEIDSGLELSRTMQEKENQLEEKRNKVLKDAREEGRQIVNEALKEAKKKEDILIATEREILIKERERLMQDLEQEKLSIFAQAKEYAIGYAVSISEKILKTKITKSEQDKLIQEAVSEIKNKKKNV